jgi:signal transduction histidine kinase
MARTESCSILLADDDRGLCTSLRDVLEALGHRVEAVFTGNGALTACAGREFDVLLLDITLPDWSGIELISKVEEIRPGLDILIITGNASLDNAVKSVSRSTIGFLVKPIDLDRLRRILGGIAQRQRVAEENRRLAADRERLIRQLAAKAAELEQYTYTVSHDLKSPLFTIGGYLGAVRKAIEEGKLGQAKEDLTRIETAAEHMQRLLRELLELSRIGRMMNPPEEISLTALAREAKEICASAAAGVVVEFEIAADLPTVCGDRIRLFQVFQNLFENAVKFMGDQPRPRVEVGVRRDRDETVIWVRDNGIGLEAEDQQKIFGLFHQLDRGSRGTGVGLALVQKIVEVHGGRVWVESTGAGRGSCFCFNLSGT